MPKKKTKKRGRPPGKQRIERDLQIDVESESATPEGNILEEKAQKETNTPKLTKKPSYTVWGIIRDNETGLFASVIAHPDSLDNLSETCSWCSYVRAYSSFESSAMRGISGPNKGKMI